jgi:uracil-DNA glycosylase
MTPAAPDRAQMLDSLLGWWRLAGLDAEPAAPTRAPSPAARMAPAAPLAAAQAAAAVSQVEAALESERLAASCDSLEALEAAVRGFDGCGLKRTARSTVFSDGTPGAPIMIVGEAPGREEDEHGKPFVGRSGQLLDRMVAAIGLERARNLYITNVIPWRPPGNLDPSAAEIGLCLPFIRRHIALAKPKAVLLVGRIAAQALLGTSEGITRLRGKWSRLPIGEDGVRALATLHPAYLLRQPVQKAAVWDDLLTLEDLGAKF